MGPFVVAGDKLIVRRVDRTTSSVGAALAVSPAVDIYAVVRNPKTGARYRFALQIASLGDPTTTEQFESLDNVPWDAEVVRVTAVPSSGVFMKRGQLYLQVGFGSSANDWTVMAQGYVYMGHVLALGENVEPGSGKGFFNYTLVAFDSAGNSDSSLSLANVNTVRRYFGVVVFLNADGNAASRIPTVRLGRTAPLFTVAAVGASGGPPTGFGGTAGSGDTFSLAGPTVTLSQEGSFWIVTFEGKDGYIASNANGTITLSSTATVPTPFPLTIKEDDVGTLDITIAAGLAGDRYAAYVLVEEWVVL